MPSSDVTYTTRNNETFGGYLATPKTDAPAPGILVIHAVWGNDDTMKGLVDAWAADGFVVSAPDIFWRVHPGPTAEKEVAFGRYEAFDPDQGMLDIEDLLKDLKSRPQCNGKVAMLGFCFGGRYAHLGAARLGIDAAAAFHGTKIGLHVDETPKVKCPVSFHFGEKDPVVPMDEVAAIKAAYAGHQNAEIVVYEGADHSFSMPGNDGYHAEVAKISRDSVLSCFRSL